jgi:hypothetical protein
VKPGETTEDPAEREIFETIKSTYTFALAPEQNAMIKELRSQLATIPARERTVLINDIENAIGQNIEEQEFE